MATLVILLLLMKTIKGSMLTTTFIDDNASNGNMFDVRNIGSTPIFIQRFAIHSVALTAINITVTIYTKSGTYVGFTNTATYWTRIHSQSVIPAGNGIATQLSTLQSTVAISGGSTQAFYITSSEPSSVRYTNGVDGSEALLYVNDSNIAIYIGVGLGNWTTTPFTPRIWNGIVYYSTTSPPTPSPTTNPSPVPTTFPTNNPTMYPTFEPTLNPTIVPTLPPSNKPTLQTANPTLSPTKYPTTNPTQNPTVSPSPSPTLPEGGIEDDYTTTEGIESSNFVEGKSSNALENMFGSLWYVILIGIAVVAFCCIVALIILWRKKQRKKGGSNIETHFEFERNVHNIVAIGSPHFAPNVAELLPLPIEGNRQRMMVTPMELHEDEENVLVTPFGDGLTPYMQVVQKCEHCGSITDGKADMDGLFYCNACWLEFVDTNDGEEADNELYRFNNNESNDVLQAQQTNGNGNETPI